MGRVGVCELFFVILWDLEQQEWNLGEEGERRSHDYAARSVLFPHSLTI